eukprot:GHVH01004591.1.p1 GENE.GHVH01004591.1~~GHVH01004591.1.p1  ORF type:complete len:697 (+),score=82.01 GHVH01004591.1:104-2194(+)
MAKNNLKKRRRDSKMGSRELMAQDDRTEHTSRWPRAAYLFIILLISVLASAYFRLFSVSRSSKPSITQDYLAQNYDPSLIGGVGFAMIIPVRDEEDFIFKTLEYFEERDDIAGNFIDQICLFDDASVVPVSSWLPDVLPSSIKNKLQIIRSDQPTGLMEGRVRCAERVSSTNLLFMDGHCRPLSGEWALALLKDLEGHRNRFVVPKVIDINVDTWEPTSDWWESESLVTSHGGTKMMFDWTFEFYWQTSLTSTIPIMVGGIYAVNREYFFEIGSYDTGMKEWGGENIEQSIRVWSCGGEITSSTRAVIGHIFNRPPKPNPGNALVERIQKNHLRVARVWLDDHISLFLKHHHSARMFLKQMTDNPNMDENKTLLKRLEIKNNMKCHNFDWFLSKFRSSFDRLGLIENDYHTLMIVPNEYDGDYPVGMATPDAGLISWHPQSDSWQKVNGRRAERLRGGEDDHHNQMVPISELIYASIDDSDNRKLWGYCLNADRKKGRLEVGYCKPDRNIANGTYDDMWINSMGRRVLRVRNAIAPIGTVFEVNSMCVLVSVKIQDKIGKSRAPVHVRNCKDIEENTIVKDKGIGDSGKDLAMAGRFEFSDLGAIFVDVERKHTRPFYDYYDQEGYGAGESGRIIWIPNTPNTPDGNDELDRELVTRSCFSGSDDCACIGSTDGFHLEWVKCVAQKEKTLKFTWAL